MDLEDLREVLHRQPFKPFDVCLADGRRLPVAHPESVAVGKRQAFVIGPDDSCSVIEPPLITSLDCINERPPRKNRRKKEAR